MASRVGSGYRVTVKNGKTVLEGKPKKYDVCTELKRATSKRVRVKKGKGNV